MIRSTMTSTLMACIALVLLTAVVSPQPAAAVTDEAKFSSILLETPRAEIIAALGDPDGNEDGSDIFMFASSPEAMMGMMEFSGGKLISRSVVMKPGVVTADALVERMKKAGMNPMSTDEGTTVFLEKEPKTGQPEYRLIIPSDDDSVTGPIFTCMTVAKFKELDAVETAFSGAKFESFDEIELGWTKAKVVSVVGNPDNVDGTLEMYMIAGSPEIMLGMIEYGNGLVEAIGTMYKPGIKNCKDLMAEYKEAGLNPINVDGERAIYLETNGATGANEYIMFEPGNDPKATGPTIMRMTVEKFKAISSEPVNPEPGK